MWSHQDSGREKKAETMEVQPVLVVEDESLIRLNLVDVLEAGGFTVLEESSGSEGIATIDAREHLCGLITDINLGSGADGWEVARHARAKFPDLAVVYITGDSAAEWSAQGVPRSLVLQKPFADAQAISAITGLLNGLSAIPAVSNPEGTGSGSST
jgi:CheY-like chemotaxis protein